MIKELATENPYSINRTMVEKPSGNLLISTVELSPEIKELDPQIGMLSEFLNFEPGKQLLEAGDYETMVFYCDEEGEPTDFTNNLDFARYPDEGTARLGHKEMVAKYSKED